MKTSAKIKGTAEKAFIGEGLGLLTVTFDGGERNVLQGNIPIGRTHQSIQIEAGLKTITLATAGDDSTTRGSDFTPSSQKVLLKAGEEVHVVFRKR
jgi:hypothetical protein